MGVRVVVKAIAPIFAPVVSDFNRRRIQVRPAHSFDRARHRRLFNICQLFQCPHGYLWHSGGDSDRLGSAERLAGDVRRA